MATRRRTRYIIVPTLVCTSIFASGFASADGPIGNFSGYVEHGGAGAGVSQAQPSKDERSLTSSHIAAAGPANAGGPRLVPALRHYWVPACGDNSPATGTEFVCQGAVSACPQPPPNSTVVGPLRMYDFQQRLGPDGQPAPGATWEMVGTACRGFDQIGPADANGRPAPGPSLPELVLAAWRNVRFTPAQVVVQPPGGTLVNLPAIFHTTDATQTFDVTLLGHAVRIYAIPTTYHWNLGDGQTLDTTTPGRPYPARDVTHTYLDHGTRQVSVDVSYRGEFTVDGGPGQPLPGQTTVNGPTADLPVQQARTRLVSH